MSMLMFEKPQTALTTVGSGRRGVTSVRRIHLLSFDEVSMTLSYNLPFLPSDPLPTDHPQYRGGVIITRSAVPVKNLHSVCAC